jgi:hypothetical protein
MHSINQHLFEPLMEGNIPMHHTVSARPQYYRSTLVVEFGGQEFKAVRLTTPQEYLYRWQGREEAMLRFLQNLVLEQIAHTLFPERLDGMSV